MNVMPIEPYIYMGGKFKHHEEPENKEGKNFNTENINPSFKQVLKDTARKLTFKGHWPNYYRNNNSNTSRNDLIYDPNGMLFPLTVIPPKEPTVGGRLNYLA